MGQKPSIIVIKENKTQLERKKIMGFFDSLLKNIALQCCIEASKDENGKPDPYKAAGMAAGLGHDSFDDFAKLGGMLGSQGAFDDDNDD